MGCYQSSIQNKEHSLSHNNKNNNNNNNNLTLIIEENNNNNSYNNNNIRNSSYYSNNDNYNENYDHNNNNENYNNNNDNNNNTNEMNHSPLEDESIILNSNDFIIHGLIQEGGIGKVYSAKRKSDNKEYALKFFGYTNVDPEERDIEKEIHVMFSFQGIEGIVQMIGYFYDTIDGIVPGKIYCNPYPVIVMELLSGGELFDKIHHNRKISELDLSKIFYQMILSVSSIHKKRYIHRDIKLENMMFTSNSPNAKIKIIDFGLMVKLPSNNNHNNNQINNSKSSSMNNLTNTTNSTNTTNTTNKTIISNSGSYHIFNYGNNSSKTVVNESTKTIKSLKNDSSKSIATTNSNTTTNSNNINLEYDEIYRDCGVVGTPGYIAPESLDYYDYSYASDVWQLGCCLYSMLSGLLPFNPPSHQQYLNHRYHPMTGPAWINISAEAKNLVQQLLQRSSKARFTLNQTLEHPWLIGKAPSNDLGDEYIERMKYLALKQKMKSFFLDSNHILDSNRNTRNQLKLIIPLLRKQSSVISRSSSGGSTSFQMTPSPLSKRCYSYLFNSSSTLGGNGNGNVNGSINGSGNINLSPQKKISTPSKLQGTPTSISTVAHRYKTTPPPIIHHTLTPPYLHHLTKSNSSSVSSKSPALKSSQSMDFLGSRYQSNNNSPVKPLSQMTETELQTKLSTFKKSVLSSLLKSTSQRSLSMNDTGSISNGHYTINKETFLCLMLDSGLPELASSRVFNIFDTDHNGVLDIKEFLLTMLAFQSHSPHPHRHNHNHNHNVNSNSNGNSSGSGSNGKQQLHKNKYHPPSKHRKTLRRFELEDIDEMKSESTSPRHNITPSSTVQNDILNEYVENNTIKSPLSPRFFTESDENKIINNINITLNNSSDLNKDDHVVHKNNNQNNNQNNSSDNNGNLLNNYLSDKFIHNKQNKSIKSTKFEQLNNIDEKRRKVKNSTMINKDKNNDDEGVGVGLVDEDGIGVGNIHLTINVDGEEEDKNNYNYDNNDNFNNDDNNNNNNNFNDNQSEESEEETRDIFADSYDSSPDKQYYQHNQHQQQHNQYYQHHQHSLIESSIEEEEEESLEDVEEDNLARLYFDIFDLDGNGSIDKDELKVAVNALFLNEITPIKSTGFGRSPPHTFLSHNPTSLHESSRDIEELFQSIDSKHTGKISFEEFKIFFKKIRRSQSESE